MNSVNKQMLALGLVVFAFSNQMLADNHADETKLSPLEIFTCSYLKGKDRDDLDKVIARWNDWMDDNSPAPYTAWVLTPNFVGPEIDFDVAWMGGWADHAGMGKSLQTWRDDGGRMNAEFFKVFSCGQHSSMAVAPMQEPGEPPEQSVVRFSDCTFAEDSGPLKVFEAHKSILEYTRAKGSTTAAWLFFPAMGAGKIDFHYKLVLGDSDFNSLAKASEIFINEGGWMEAAKTMAGKASCDSPRLYNAELVRNGMSK